MEKCPFCATEIPAGASVCAGCQAQKTKSGFSRYRILSSIFKFLDFFMKAISLSAILGMAIENVTDSIEGRFFAGMSLFSFGTFLLSLLFKYLASKFAKQEKERVEREDWLRKDLR